MGFVLFSFQSLKELRILELRILKEVNLRVNLKYIDRLDILQYFFDYGCTLLQGWRAGKLLKNFLKKLGRKVMPSLFGRLREPAG